jgi:hypothetical protein
MGLVAALDDLLRRVDDPALRADLERELEPLRGDQELGLVFERHLPEKVRLPGLPVRRGATVEVRQDLTSPTWQVVRLRGSEAELVRKEKDGTSVSATRPVDQLIRVQEFGAPIYPGLRSVVSESEREILAGRGLGPGDPEWEAQGIFEFIARPRLEAALTGRTINGTEIEGSYRFVDESPIASGFEENLEFFVLTYEDPDRIQLGAAFEAVAPLLWLMAGAIGPRVDRIEGKWALPDRGRYGVLFDTNAWPEFCQAVLAARGVTHAFVVTSSDAVFQRVAAELPDEVHPVRLYDSYLTSFLINTGARS